MSHSADDARELLPAEAQTECLIRKTLLQKETADEFLRRVPLFRLLPEPDIPMLAQAMTVKKFAEGETVFKQGEKGDCFYLIHSGEVNVLVHEVNYLNVGDKVRCLKDLHFGGKKIPKGSLASVDKFDDAREFPYTIRIQDNGYRGRVLPEEVERLEGPPESKQVATLRRGDYFGEHSLLKGTNRSATIVPTSELTTFCLTREKFKQFALGTKLMFGKRKAVMAPDAEESKAVELIPKTDEEKELIRECIRSNSNLNSLLTISDDQLEQLCSKAYKETNIKKGHVLIQQGDLAADKFYMVAKGSFSFHIEKKGPESEHDRTGIVGKAQAGSSFGELALLYHAPRAATVTCLEDDSEVYVIERYAFKHTLMQHNDQKMALYMKVFDNVELFNVLTSDEKISLAEVLVEVRYQEKDNIVVEGEGGDAFYILTEGKVQFLKSGNKVHEVEATKGGQAHWFGERALLMKEPRAATAYVSSATATCLALTKKNFEALLGPLSDLMMQKIDKQERVKSQPASPQPDRPQIDMGDLKRMGLLGCGGFGAVTLEKHKKTGDIYALKALSKGYVLKMKMQKGVLREKEILWMCDSQFVVKLYQTFKTKEHLYFLMEAAMGGELFATYHKRRFHGSVSKAKFYAASVVYAFEHLHERGVIFRDLKPENLLLDIKGYCKMTDMGLAKILPNGTKTYTTCGTPDYFAPEVIQQTGMNKAVDWWTLGILIHELLSGHAPFDAKEPMETYQKIVRGIGSVSFSYKDRDPDATDLVKQLLKHCPSERLPMRAGGTDNIKKHAWYKGFDWQGLEAQTVKPPYVPEAKSQTDMSNFRAQEADLPPQIPYKDPGTGWDDTF